MEAYYEFATKLLEDKKGCYSLRGWRSNSDALDKISSISKESKESKEVLEEKSKEEEKGLSYKDNIKENRLSYRELLIHTRAMVNAYVKNDDNELSEEVKRSYKGSEASEVPSKEEMGNVVVFMLKSLEGLLDKRFQIKKTAFQRQDEEFKQLKAETIKKEEEAKQVKRRADQEAQRADQEAQRADHEAQRLSLIEEVEDLFTERILSSNIDDELRKAILKDQRKIKREIVKCIMEYHFSPEQVIGAVMEEIKSNEERIVREGTVDNELIEVGIRNFVLQDMEEKQRKRAIDLMYSRANSFKVPEKTIMENQNVQGNLEQQCIFLVLNEDYVVKFRNMCVEYKNIRKVLESKQVIGKEESDKLSELANESDRLSKSFAKYESKENELAMNDLKFDDMAIDELMFDIVMGIKRARTEAEQEREVLIKEKNTIEEMVMRLQMPNLTQTPNSAFDSMTHEPMPGPSWGR